MSLRAAMYPRVSTDIQRDNYSIPSQIKEIVRYAEDRGYVLVGDRFVDPITGKDCAKNYNAIPAFVDDYTSTELSRPGLDAAFIYARTIGFDILLVHAIDRLARDPYFRQTIEREFTALGVRVEYVLGNYDESPEGEVRKDLDATFAKWENAKRVERSNRGKKRKAEMGKFVTGRAPYGYRADPNAEGGLAVYEPEAEIVRLIFRLYVEERYSLHQIVRQLERLNVKTYLEFDRWSHGTVAKLLRNSVYIGFFYYNVSTRKGKKQIKREKSEWIKIYCSPIVPEDVFNAATEIRKSNKENLRKKPKRFYLLSGMLFCSVCEKPYVAQTVVFTKPYGRFHKGYRHRMSQGHCHNKWLSTNKIEPIVWDKVVQILLHPDSLRKGYEKMIEEKKEKNSHQIKHLETLNTGIEKINGKRTRLQAVYLDPDIGMTKEEFLHEKRALDEQLESLHEDIERIENELSQVPTEEDLADLEKMAFKVRELLGSKMDIEDQDKRQIMEMLNLKVLISPDKKVKIEGWVTPENNGLLSISSSLKRSHNLPRSSHHKSAGSAANMRAWLFQGRLTKGKNKILLGTIASDEQAKIPRRI